MVKSEVARKTVGAHNGSVGVEEVVARHAGLARHARGDDDQIGTLEALGQLIGASVALHGAAAQPAPRDVQGQARVRGVVPKRETLV